MTVADLLDWIVKYQLLLASCVGVVAGVFGAIAAGVVGFFTRALRQERERHDKRMDEIVKAQDTKRHELRNSLQTLAVEVTRRGNELRDDIGTLRREGVAREETYLQHLAELSRDMARRIDGVVQQRHGVR